MQEIITITNEKSVRDAIASPDNLFQDICLAPVTEAFTFGYNTGNTLYNLYRTEAVRKAKVPGKIWHWVTVEGEYYLGVIMVDSPGGVEDISFKFHDQEIGKIRLDQGDGRRHLYMFSEPINFKYAETFEINTAADDMPYVIEGVVFTPSIPEEHDIELQDIGEALTTPEFAAWMLPDQLTVTNPGKLSGNALVDISLTLPGITESDFQVIDANGQMVGFELLPLTQDNSGVPLTQQLRLPVNLTGKEKLEYKVVDEKGSEPLGPELKLTETKNHLVIANGERQFEFDWPEGELKVAGISQEVFGIRSIAKVPEMAIGELKSV